MYNHAIRWFRRSNHALVREALSTHKATDYQSKEIAAGSTDSLVIKDMLLERPLSAEHGKRWLVRHLPSGNLKILVVKAGPNGQTMEVFAPDWSVAEVRQEMDSHVGRKPVGVWSRFKIGIVATATILLIIVMPILISQSSKPSLPDESMELAEPTIITAKESFRIE